MDRLPQEMVSLILLWCVRMCRTVQNSLVPLRLVCRTFNAILKSHVFRTVQLEYSRVLKIKEGKMSTEALSEVGELASALYVDMMVVRDEDEIQRLSEVFHGITGKVPEMVTLIESLRRYCINESTFDGGDFRRILADIFASTQNVSRLKLNLPFQVVGRSSETSTLLLANALACIASRPEECASIDTLVLDHISDRTINNIFNNHIDVANAFKTFSTLTHLVLSLKRQEDIESRQIAFCKNFWLLIRRAVDLESLCIIGWNVKRDAVTRRHHLRGLSLIEWEMRSLPYPEVPVPGLRHLRYLELKRVDIAPQCLLGLISENSHSLKELYLNEVYLKIWGAPPVSGRPTALWIGHSKAPITNERAWIAHSLFTMEHLKLDILRATGLGYDDMRPARDAPCLNYDLDDSTLHGRSFDERFVTASMGSDELYLYMVSEALKTPYPYNSISPAFLVTSSNSTALIPPPNSSLPLEAYDAETCQRFHNTTSLYKRCIDGLFFNHNDQALRELQRIIEVADRGMNLLSTEIERGVEGFQRRTGGN